ncbi:MAG: signal peptide peptidase SppA [Arachnia sp.]
MPLTDLFNCLSLGRNAPIVLELDLARGLLETSPRNPFQALQALNATSMAAVRAHLEQAREDDRVLGLIVHAVDPGQPLSVLDEVAELIAYFGEKKPTAAWAESFGELSQAMGAYQVAAAAQHVWLQPTGALGISGVDATIVLFKHMFAKIGVEPQFGQRWEYKSAADQYSADEVTQANREMMTRLVDSTVATSVATIAARRGQSIDEVWDAVNNSPLAAAEALERGLVDALGYRDEVYAACLADWGAEPDHLRYVQRYSAQQPIAASFTRRRWPKVAVVRVQGGIDTGRGRSSGPMGESTGADVVDEQLRAVLRDENIKAVLLDVDSPGGSAVASDFIRRSVIRVRESGRPVVARMGSVAASGGYYVSMGCNEIVAQASTLTGSIGVLAGKFVTAGLYEKLGIVREPVRSGAQAGMLSSATAFTDDDWVKLNEFLDRVYLDFTTLAAKDRGMDYEALEALAKGRVWTGADALAHGLIDHIGGWRLAYERACRLAGVSPEASTVHRMSRLGPLEQLLPAASSESVSASAVPVAVGPEDLLQRAAAWLGLPVHGALSLPFGITLR